MGERQRVDGQPAFVLHTHAFRETSLVVDAFSRDYGRVALLARGARRPRSPTRGLLMAFQPLELAWSGRGEVMTLTGVEWQGGQPLLSGRALFCAFYLNELLLGLLPHEVAHEGLYSIYEETLRRFAVGIDEADLRRFEMRFLQEIGYGLTLTHDVSGMAIDPDAVYAYEVERGPVKVSTTSRAPNIVHGSTLVCLSAGEFSERTTLNESKSLMRELLQHYLTGRDLETRKIFRDLQDL